MTRLLAFPAAAFLLIASGSIALSEDCPVAETPVDKFLPQTTAPRNVLPDPPIDNDCAFYNWAWQSFLFVTQSSTDMQPSFLSYETVEDVFGQSATRKFASVELSDRKQGNILSLAPRDAKQVTQVQKLDGGFRQAGDLDAILIDQNRNAIYYSIHLNPHFAEFVRDNHLNDLKRLLAKPNEPDAIPASLKFNTGAIELKAAWQIVEAGDDRSTYFTTRARVPVLKNAGEQIVRDGDKTREVTVALLGLHVVGTIDGHPEFIWASFEHADPKGRRDIAPAAKANPVGDRKTQEIDDGGRSYPLFQGAATAAGSNVVPDTYSIDEASQKFTVATSVYREYPGSQSEKPNDGEPEAPWEDPAVFNLNKNIGILFDKTDPGAADLRRNYRLVAAVWINQPDQLINVGGNQVKTFRENAHFPDEVLAGEKRMSNMAMESFTQDDVTGSPNCFTCHNTRESDLVGPNGETLPPRQINVSHIFEFFAKSKLGTR